MQRRRWQTQASGCIWVIVLAALAWAALGPWGGPRSAGHGVGLVSAAAAVGTTPPRGLSLAGGPNADRWYAGPAGYVWEASGPESGIRRCQGGTIEAVDSAVPRTVYGTCVNGAGLAAPLGRFSFRYDGTPRRLAPVAVPWVVTRFGLVVAEPHGTDSLSGVARQSCNGDRRLSTRRLGLHTVQCYVKDRAGNLATAQLQFLVVGQGLH